MSTFNGIVAEFPDIRVDFFRHSPGRQPPLACFLSHVHSDHLAGLESFRAPFLYCSAATREILLRLERYPCRINFAKGILEARVQTFKNLRTLMRPIPLETPTELELSPANKIRVTLFDANHCPGAVIFLFEGQGKAVLYTGDIRSEPWFVNSLARSPAMIPYTSGIRTLDKVYLDTSMIEDILLQSKAEGIAELVRKVARYPPDTVFYLQAWTYGYEDVWVALSNALNSPIHVDEYKMNIFKSLRTNVSGNQFSPSVYLSPEAPALTGHLCGNTEHTGCLTLDQNVRIHSCEKGTSCSVIANRPVVWIKPIVAHLDGGIDHMEVGVGGGGDDLEREAELDLSSSHDLPQLLQLIKKSTEIPEELRSDILELLTKLRPNGRNIGLDLDISAFDGNHKAGLQQMFGAISKLSHPTEAEVGTAPAMLNDTHEPLLRRITFPYARHSSLPELRHLVQAFKPRDVWPCTVHPEEWVQNCVSIRSLFADCCSGDVFDHDAHMDAWAAARTEDQPANDTQREQETQSSNSVVEQAQISYSPPSGLNLQSPPSGEHTPQDAVASNLVDDVGCENARVGDMGGHELLNLNLRPVDPNHQDSQHSGISVASAVSRLSGETSLERADAHAAMTRNLAGSEWTAISLLSTTGHHTHLEMDVGGRSR